MMSIRILYSLAVIPFGWIYSILLINRDYSPQKCSKAFTYLSFCLDPTLSAKTCIKILAKEENG